jgi:filamentous hemagglutinin family protein
MAVRHLLINVGLILGIQGVTASWGLGQTIQPANDATQTRVDRHSNRYDITGGQRSNDNANLFHSFEQFGLSPAEIADFQSAPEIQNILVRVTGGQASRLDGLLRVSGGISNLFLLNPAGVLFGPTARLDLPASLTVTTASGIEFDRHWFSAIGTNDYGALVGNPNQFAFALGSGTIVNTGNLSVNPGQSLTLLGGTVINTGQLTAPGGDLTLAAVPGQSRVRLSQAGRLLSVEMPVEEGGPNPLTLTPQSLPALLTGGNLENASGLRVAEDGSVQLTHSHTPVSSEAGTAIAAGTLDVSASGQGGYLMIVGDRLTQLSGASLNASGNGGGTVLVGGDLQGSGAIRSDRTQISLDSRIQADALTAGNGGQVIVWADDTTDFRGNITARGSSILASDGGFAEVSGQRILNFDGLVDLSAPQGALGTLLLDPDHFYITDNPAEFATRPLGTFLSPTTLINQLGDINLLATQTIVLGSGVSLILSGSTPRNITFKAGSRFQMDPTQTIQTMGGGSITIRADQITAGRLITSPTSSTESGGDIILSALRDITATGVYTETGSGLGSAGDVTIASERGDITVGAIDTSINAAANAASGGDVSITSDRGSITLGTVDTAATGGGGNNTGAGSVTLRADDDITTGAIHTANDSAFESAGGNVNIFSNRGNLTLGAIDTSIASLNRSEAGSVSLTSLFGDIRVGSIDASSSGVGNGLAGGTVVIDSDRGLLDIGSIDTSTGLGWNQTAGSITLRSAQATTVGWIDTRSSSIFSAGGNLEVTADRLSVTQTLPVTSASIATQGGFSSTSGNVTIRHSGNPTFELNAGMIVPNGTFGTIETGNGQLQLAPFPLNGPSAPIAAPSVPVAPIVTPPVVAPIIAPTPIAPTPAPLVNAPQPIASPPPPTGTMPSSQPGAGPLQSEPSARGGNHNPPAPVQSFNSGAENAGLRQPDPDEEVVVNEPSQSTHSQDSPLAASDLSSHANGLVTVTAVTDAEIARLDQQRSQQFVEYLGLGEVTPQSAEVTRQAIRQVEEQLGLRTALVYIQFVPEDGGWSDTPQDSDRLELATLSARRQTRVSLDVTRAEVLAVAQQFRDEVTNPRKTQTQSYLSTAQQLYQWLIYPLQSELVSQNITNLVLLPEAGMRSLPYAALHDGEQFLIEQYSLGLMPSFSLTQTRPLPSSDNAEVLAIGVSESTQGQTALPNVSIELETLMNLRQQQGMKLLNQAATIQNLQQLRQENDFRIIHLATHANFRPGQIENSFLQFWGQRIYLHQLSQLQLDQPPVDLLVLSACRTALGDREAELGFAGIAVQAGVRSVLASLWYVSDAATTALMSKFYEELNRTPIKAEALRQAQIAMARGEIRVENGQLTGLGLGAIALPAEATHTYHLTHPYYWAAFSMIGNSW